jgi:hypothetical protein
MIDKIGNDVLEGDVSSVHTGGVFWALQYLRKFVYDPSISSILLFLYARILECRHVQEYTSR